MHTCGPVIAQCTDSVVFSFARLIIVDFSLISLEPATLKKTAGMIKHRLNDI